MRSATSAAATPRSTPWAATPRLSRGLHRGRIRDRRKTSSTFAGATPRLSQGLHLYKICKPMGEYRESKPMLTVQVETRFLPSSPPWNCTGSIGNVHKTHTKPVPGAVVSRPGPTAQGRFRLTPVRARGRRAPGSIRRHLIDRRFIVNS